MPWRSPGREMLIAAVPAFLCAVLLVGMGTTILTLPVTRECIDRKVEALLETLLAAEVSLHGVRTDLVGRVAIDKVVVRARSGRPDSVAVGEVRVRYSLVDLLSRRMRFRAVSAGKLTAFVTRSVDGVVKAPFARQAMPEGLRRAWRIEAARSRWTLTVSSVRIRNLDIVYHDSAAGLEGAIAGVAVEAEVPRVDSAIVRLEAREGRWESRWWSGSLDTLHVACRVGPRGLEVDRALAVAGGVRVAGEGTVPFAAGVPWRLRVDADAAAKELEFLRRFIPSLAPRGHISASGWWLGPMRRPFWGLTIRARGLGYDGYAVDSLSVHASYDGGSVLSADVAARGALGTLAARGQALVPDLRRPRIAGYTVDVGIRGLRAGAIRGLPARVPGALTRGTATRLRAHFAGRGTTTPPVHSFVSATVRGAPFHPKPLRFEAAVDSIRWSIAGSWGRNTVRGTGSCGGGLDGVLVGALREPELFTDAVVGERVEGGVTVRADVGGTVRRPRFRAAVGGAAIRCAGLVVDTLDGVVSWGDGPVKLERFRATLHGVADSLLARHGMGTYGGGIEADLTASGTAARPRGALRFRGTEVRLGSFHIDTVTGRCALRGRDTVVWRDLLLWKGGVPVGGEGMILLRDRGRLRARAAIGRRGARGPGAAGALELSGTVSPERADIRFRLDTLDMAVLRGWLPLPAELGGRLSAGGGIRRDAGEVSGSARFRAARPAVEGIGVLALKGKVVVEGSAARLHSTLQLFDSLSTVGVEARIPLVRGAAWKVERGGGRGLTVTVEADSVPAVALSGVLGERLTGTEGFVRARVLARRTGGTWRLEGGAAAKRVGLRFEPLRIGFSSVSLDALLGGTADVPFLSVDCTTGEVRLRSFVVDSSRWEGFLRNDSLIVSAGRAHPRGGGELRLGGRVALNGEEGGLGTGLGFVLEEVPLAIVEPFARGLRATGGVLRGNGVVTFDKGRPRTRGSLFIDNGVFEYPGIETTIGPVRGAVSIRNDSLLLRRLTVGLGDGAVGAGGRIVLRPDSGAAVDLRLWADAPSLRLPDLARIEVREARLRLTSRGDGYLLSGRAALDDTRIVKDVWLPELIAHGERGGSARAPRPFMRKIALAVRVDLRRNLSIDVNLADLRLGGTATLSGTAADPRVNGTVEVVEGDVYYLDRRFEAVGGHLRFARSRLLNPTIALSARTDVVAVVPRSTSELPGTESYTITLTVSGPLSDPEMILTAQPPLSQADIVSVLTLGTTLGAVGTELGERVQALAANQLLGFGARKLERLLGLEEVLVTGDVAGAHVEAGPHITVTKRITRYLTLSYATAVRALDEREVSAVLRLTRFLFLVGSTDQDGTSSVDLKIRLTW